MRQSMRLGFSPCPNDTFIFYALAEGRVSANPYRLDLTIADVEALNREARNGALDVSKVSTHAILHLLEDYHLLGSGGAIGRGCGPLVASSKPMKPEELGNKSIAIPGRHTTANLLLQLSGFHQGESVEMQFDQIMPSIASGKVEAGVIIHEGRFTYPALGLELVLDLGQWWELKTGLPLPLGGIVMRRDMGLDAAQFMENKIRESLLYARTSPKDAWPYIRERAQEMAPEVIHRHIDMFVNDFSMDAGFEGKKAVRYMLEAAAKLEGLPLPEAPVFWDDAL